MKKTLLLIFIIMISCLSSYTYEDIKKFKAPKELKVNVEKHFRCDKQKSLALAISFKETRFQNLINKTNREHSVGYFQLNLNTVDYINSKFGYMESVSEEDLYNNIELQTFLFSKYLDYLMKKYNNNMDRVLRAYNGGINGWRKTKDEYVNEIVYNYNKLIGG